MDGGEEQILHFFVWSIWRYFKVTTEVEPRVENPYLLETDPDLKEFTAVISITGMSKGIVYFTIDRPFLDKLLMFYPIPDRTDEMLRDLVGEIANTIAGNVREYLGEGFVISPPRVLENATIKLERGNDRPSFVLPITWEGERCKLFVSLELERRKQTSLATV